MTAETTIQELLKPRYLLTADFPGCSFEVGTILEPNEEGELYSKKAGYSWTVSRVLEKDVKKFKHLFRKLEWWECRKKEEMPDFIKVGNQILKVDKWDMKSRAIAKVGDVWFERHLISPATEAEYNSCLSSVNKEV